MQWRPAPVVGRWFTHSLADYCQVLGSSCFFKNRDQKNLKSLLQNRCLLTIILHSF